MALLDMSEPKGISFIAGARSVARLALHDTNTFEVTRAIHCGSDGSIKVMMEDGTTETFNVVTGALYPYRIKRLYSTGTTAAAVVSGLY